MMSRPVSRASAAFFAPAICDHSDRFDPTVVKSTMQRSSKETITVNKCQPSQQVKVKFFVIGSAVLWLCCVAVITNALTMWLEFVSFDENERTGVSQLKGKSKPKIVGRNATPLRTEATLV